MVTLIFVSTISLLALLIGALIQSRRRFLVEQRLGLLGIGETPSDEERRAARLAELGEEGTYKTFNCGEILHVDYERGELICARDRWRR